MAEEFEFETFEKNKYYKNVEDKPLKMFFLKSKSILMLSDNYEGL